MNQDVKTLIAIGASVAVNCRPCTEHHLAQARQVDLADQQIAAAVEIGLQVNSGAHNKTRGWANELLNGEVATTADAGCGCQEA